MTIYRPNKKNTLLTFIGSILVILFFTPMGIFVIKFLMNFTLESLTSQDVYTVYWLLIVFGSVYAFMLSVAIKVTPEYIKFYRFFGIGEKIKYEEITEVLFNETGVKASWPFRAPFVLRYERNGRKKEIRYYFESLISKKDFENIVIEIRKYRKK